MYISWAYDALFKLCSIGFFQWPPPTGCMTNPADRLIPSGKVARPQVVKNFFSYNHRSLCLCLCIVTLSHKTYECWPGSHEINPSVCMGFCVNVWPTGSG